MSSQIVYNVKVITDSIKDVVINIGDDYLKQAAVLAQDLAKFSRIDRMHVLQVDCSTESAGELLSKIPNLPFKIECYSVTDQIKSLPNTNSMRGVPIASFGRLIIPEVLPKSIKKVLYIDVDVKVRKNIDELLKCDFEQIVGGVRQKSVGLLNSSGNEIDN